MKVRQEVLKHGCASGTSEETDRCIINCVRSNKKQHWLCCWFCGKVGHKKVDCFAHEKSINMAKKDETSEEGGISVGRDLEVDQEASSLEPGTGVVCGTKGKEIEMQQKVMQGDHQEGDSEITPKQYQRVQSALSVDEEGLMVKMMTHEGIHSLFSTSVNHNLSIFLSRLVSLPPVGISDPISGNWWLAIGVDTFEPVGYWPAELFTTMSDHATTVEWGGEILYRNTSGLSTITQMGSGEFPEKGYRKSAYFCNLNVAEEHNSLQPVEDFNLQADHEELYTIMKSNTEACGNHFYFGGPGHGPVPSTAVRATATFVFLFSAVLLVL
uniref:Uncharacterized protein n=1 Tax=Brassica oleracea TaxID=3712 RepID=A0A3P6E169_BRAOL|nr:unnamed protein product [Brassica oleracea]